MKKLLNPMLKTEGITMIDTSSLDEKIESSKGKRKGKKPLKTEEESSLTQTKLSAVFLELRGEMLKKQQKEDIEVSYSENKLLMDEIAPTKTDNQEDPSVYGVSTELLPKDEDIFRNLNIPWLPSELKIQQEARLLTQKRKICKEPSNSISMKWSTCKKQMMV